MKLTVIAPNYLAVAVLVNNTYRLANFTYRLFTIQKNKLFGKVTYHQMRIAKYITSAVSLKTDYFFHMFHGIPITRQRTKGHPTW